MSQRIHPENRSAHPHHHCEVCGDERNSGNLVPISVLSPALLGELKKLKPEFNENGYLCTKDANRLRSGYVQKIFEEEIENVSDLEKSVIESLNAHELLTLDTLEDNQEELSKGEQLADGVARFGGSWSFILSFTFLLLLWILFNGLQLFSIHFDPFPFILLNLVLSCLAALQAPIIMMSQNRQEAKDRKRSENDYRVNLKAELEIRHLHEKIDHLLIEQWKRLAEIQQTQIELLESMRP